MFAYDGLKVQTELRCLLLEVFGLTAIEKTLETLIFLNMDYSAGSNVTNSAPGA